MKLTKFQAAIFVAVYADEFARLLNLPLTAATAAHHAVEVAAKAVLSLHSVEGAGNADGADWCDAAEAALNGEAARDPVLTVATTDRDRKNAERIITGIDMQLRESERARAIGTIAIALASERATTRKECGK